MSDQELSVTNRLCEAGSPRHLPNWNKNAGYYVATCRVSPADIPKLIEIACKWNDPDWPYQNPDLDSDSEEIQLLPITAWRTLADLQCGDSVDPLIRMLCDLDDDDDWSREELPDVFGKIGKPAVASLIQLANDSEKPVFARTIAVNALQSVAEYHPECRSAVVAQLTEMMTRAAECDIDLNSSVLVGLVDLQAVGAAEAIERAFANDRIDAGMIGDWEYVRKQLGVEGLRLEKPKRPHNSVVQFRTRMGIGIFSEEAIFSVGDCDPKSEAEQAYYERARKRFSQSKEAEQVVDRFGELRWLWMFLEFGIQYHSIVVDAMTQDFVAEFVLDYVPRKVSTEPTSAASIIYELTKFWEYVQRVYELPAAKSIIDWLNTDGLAEDLATELANPENFGMAKSIVMAGKARGHDMMSEQGVADFMAEINRGDGLLAKPSKPGTLASIQPRVGRNDPCPCGSGKKYKKCCLRH